MDKVYKEVSTKEINKLVESNIYEGLTNDSYKIYITSAKNLLSYNRFDLAFKIFFLEMLDLNYEHAAEVYLEHIRAFSFGSFKEPNNDEKNSKDKFIKIFIELYDNISSNKFDPERSILPLSNSGFILNGAHRLASAIYGKKDVFYVNTSNKGVSFDYNFFYERNVSESYLDIGATVFAEQGKNLFIALIWPSANGMDAEIEGILEKVVYKKKVLLNMNGAHNLMSQVYEDEKWLGNIENDFKGTSPKIIECFKNIDNELRIYLFQSESLEDVVEKKDNVRSLFNIGKHSIHITDTHDEVIKLSKILFNNNSIHFLNFAKPNVFISFHQKLNSFKDLMKVNSIDAKDVILDSGMIMSLYGIRKSEDLDYIINDKYNIDSDDSSINSHNNEIEYHKQPINQLIYNSKNYFYFNGVKFISLNQLYIFKKNRNGEKDRNDLLLLDALLEKDSKKMKSAKLKQKMFYVKHKIKYAPIIILIKLLKGIGLYDSVRRVYHNLKTKN